MCIPLITWNNLDFTRLSRLANCVFKFEFPQIKKKNVMSATLPASGIIGMKSISQYLLIDSSVSYHMTGVSQALLANIQPPESPQSIYAANGKEMPISRFQEL